MTLAAQISSLATRVAQEVKALRAEKADTSHTHVATVDLTATGTKSTATYLRGDNTWATPPNTTYAVPTQAEAEAGTAATGRAFSAQRVNQAIQALAPVKPGHAHVTTDITGVWAPSALGSGTPNASTWLRGDGVWQVIPAGPLNSLTDVTAISPVTGNVLRWNGTAWANAAVAISDVTGLQGALDGKSATSHVHAYEPTISGGTTAQFWRGDKSWQALFDATVPAALGSAAAGSAAVAARRDHVHTMPSAAQVGAAASSHTHTKANITDFAHTHTVAEVSGAGPLTGEIKLWPTNNIPSGYLRCDGTAYAAATYPALAAVLGVNGSNQVVVPDLRDAVPVGASATKLIATSGGSATKTLAPENLPSHSHTINHDHGVTGTDGAHTHSLNYSNATGGAMTNIPKGTTTYSSSARLAVDLEPGHTHNVPAHSGSSGNTGSGAPFDVQNPYVAINYIIKT